MPASPNHAVIIAGGGPTGLMLAGELALAGIDVAIVERRLDQTLVGNRAGGLHSRTLEILDMRGIADRFLAEGQKFQNAGFAGVQFDLSTMPSRFPFGLGLWQTHTERLLLGWIGELGVPVIRGRELTGLAETADGVTVTLGDGTALTCRYLVGCDGGRSLVRKLAGFEFVGTEPTTSNLIAQVEMTGSPPLGVHRTALGLHSFGRADYKIVDGQIIYAETGPIGVMVTEPEVGTAEPTLEDLRSALIAAAGTDYGLTRLLWISRFTDATRQATTYGKGRVLISGDAAHIHPPDGGQGMQLGLHDAVNLGWKLAQVVNGISSATLLDSYTAERHPLAARVLRLTLASVALRRDDDRTRALRDTFADVLSLPEAKARYAGIFSGLDVAYDLGQGTGETHPQLGRRVPDLDLETAAGPSRLYAHLSDATPLLLNLRAAGALDGIPRPAHVKLLDATTTNPWLLPVVGRVPTPTALLIRPDGHAAWVGEAGSTEGLSAAMERWF